MAEEAVKKEVQMAQLKEKYWLDLTADMRIFHETCPRDLLREELEQISVDKEFASHIMRH